MPERHEETGSLRSTLPGADEMRDGGLITSDPGLLAVRHKVSYVCSNEFRLDGGVRCCLTTEP